MREDLAIFSHLDDEKEDEGKEDSELVERGRVVPSQRMKSHRS
jgi:hypothetical protein